MSVTLTQVRRGQRALLSKLSDEELEPLLPLMELVRSNLREVLYKQGGPIDYVYFPSSAIYSCLLCLSDGGCVELGTIGNEGFIGIELLLDATVAFEQIICRHPGESLRMAADDFRKAIAGPTQLRHLLARVGQAYLAQVSQSVACNRLHSIDMRFARWLLITHDRVKEDEFELTQEFVALMLGVHRPSVSLVANMFMQAGIIQYSRGRMKILDRARLEEAACECYGAVRAQFQHLLDIPYG